VLIDVVAMGEEWRKFTQKIVGLQSDLTPFEVDFLDRDSFKKFCDNLPHDVGSPYQNIFITGYFSETIREPLERIIKMKRNVRLICPEFSTQSRRDRRNLEALKKLAKAGAEIKINNRLHARFLVAHSPVIEGKGFLVIGSFDFNTECIGKERYDAGIKTRHPDLVKSATELFEQIWDEPESIPLEDFMKKGKS